MNKSALSVGWETQSSMMQPLNHESDISVKLRSSASWLWRKGTPNPLRGISPVASTPIWCTLTKTRVIVVRFKRRSLIRRLLASDHPLKAASSGTGLALAPLEIFCGQSFVSISTPEKTLIGFSPRLLGHSKVDQIWIPRASHSDQGKCRVAQMFMIVARCCLRTTCLETICTKCHQYHRISRAGRHHLPSSRFFADQAPH
jgi:hypothetical protein